MTIGSEPRWTNSSGLTQIIAEVRPAIYNAKVATPQVSATLLNDLQQAALYLQQQMTHRRDTESLTADVRRLERDLAATQVDRDRKLRAANKREAAALTIAAKAGISDPEIDAQLAHDRHLAQLAHQRETDLVKSRNALLAWVQDLRTKRLDATVTVGQILGSLDKVLAGGKTTLQVETQGAPGVAPPVLSEALFDIAPAAVATAPAAKSAPARRVVRDLQTTGGRL